MHVLRTADFVVEVNERLGGEIARARYRDHDLLAAYDWASPVGVGQSATYGDPKLDWLSEYRGGWQLLVPNAGAACEVDRVPLPFHGEWSRTHVTVTERAVDRVVMTAGLRLPITVEREVRVAAQPDRLLVRTTVTNVSPKPVHFIWVEHPAFAVGHEDKIDMPQSRVVAADGSDLGRWSPDVLARVDASRPCESVHFLVDLCDGWAALRRREYGIALAWSVADFPHAWLWHEIASPGFPFYRRSSLVAIEPASCWPGGGLSDAIATGRAMRLDVDESRSTTVAMIPFDTDGRAVTGASIAGQLTFGSPS